jgi:hypothetical protein
MRGRRRKIWDRPKGYDQNRGIDMDSLIALGPCVCCGRIFCFNPQLVPVVDNKAKTREPVCRDCIELANRVLKRNGLQPIEISPGAYQTEEIN